MSRRSFESPKAEEKRGAVKRARAARKTNGAPEVRDPCGPRKGKGASRETARKGRRGQFGHAGRGAMAPQGSLDEYLREISAYPLIDRAEEAALARRIARGEREALCKLVNSNLRFVVSIAKKYQNQGVALADLISEGNLGLIRAAEKFDETKGVKFISYAVWWIRQAILQALAEQSRIVRVPLN
ncbi:MAG: sigma-70 family RNA polymerase sigma factor, partial [Gemmatimonadota bacterium]